MPLIVNDEWNRGIVYVPLMQTDSTIIAEIQGLWHRPQAHPESPSIDSTRNDRWIR